jgi:hypothetical protein
VANKWRALGVESEEVIFDDTAHVQVGVNLFNFFFFFEIACLLPVSNVTRTLCFLMFSTMTYICSSRNLT